MSSGLPIAKKLIDVCCADADSLGDCRAHVWRKEKKPKALHRGREQVASYATRLGRKVGYPVLFDRQREWPWEERGTFETFDHLGVRGTFLSA